ncbi:MAG: MbcA/ParS/Xre antitoxin family protein, partial [Firmicutes bacterium]|nr:MbcA/ParS/Xre antitoxin family protein [Bacillota bacterium]
HETADLRWYDLLDRRGHARLGVHQDYVVSYADILDDIAAVEKQWSELVAPEDWEIVNSRLLFQPPAAELEKIWYIVIKEQETERWLQTPHRELDDKTPREVMDEPQGQERLLAVLDAFGAQTAENEYSRDLLNYMRQRIQP